MLAARGGTPEEVVNNYIDENLRHHEYVADCRKPLLTLVQQAREGVVFTRLPENSLNGDSICKACPRLGKECWHGHAEYTFDFPSKKLPRLPKTRWNNFSIDLQINKPILLPPPEDSQNATALLKRNSISMFGMARHECPREFLPPGIGMMRFFSFEKETDTENIVKFVYELGSKMLNVGGSGTEIRFVVSDSHSTSMRPEGYILSHDWTASRLF